jgi:transcriptional regulator with XRE-family HTH domain
VSRTLCGHLREVFPLPPDNLRSIADRIKWLLEVTGLPQRELARRADLAETQINVILKRLRTRPYAIEVETVYKIARGAEVRGEWLLTGAGTPSSPDVHFYPRLRDFSLWPFLLQEAKLFSPALPLWAWEWAGSLHLPGVSQRHLSPAGIYQLAYCGFLLLAYDHPPPQAEFHTIAAPVPKKLATNRRK